MEVEHARREIWDAVSDELSLPELPRRPLDPANPRV
jgi:hypothetical protein